MEIIANRSVEENILEAIAKENAGKYYTKYPVVYGIGSTGPRMGDAVWPEENFAIVIWCGEDEARRIERAVDFVKAQFPDEGIKLFGIGRSAADHLSVADQVYAVPEATARAAPVETPPHDGPEDPNAE
jgi:hypothetical protein